MTYPGVACLPVGASSATERRVRISDVMRPPAYAVARDTPVAAAATLLSTTGCSGVPVVSRDGRVVGLVTEADLVRHQLRSARAVSRAVVGDLMSVDPLLAPQGYDLDALVGLMLAAGSSVVPIVDGCRLVGMVDLRDLVSLVGGADVREPRTRQASGH